MLKPTGINVETVEHPPLSPVLALGATRTFPSVALHLTLISRSLNEQEMWSEGNKLAHALEIMTGTHQAAHTKSLQVYKEVGPSASGEGHCWSPSWYWYEENHCEILWCMWYYDTMKFFWEGINEPLTDYWLWTFFLPALSSTFACWLMWLCKLSMVCTFVGLLIPTNFLSYLLLGILWFSFPLTPYACSILHFTGNWHGCKLKEECAGSACLWACHQLQRQRGEDRVVHEGHKVKYSLGPWMLQCCGRVT